MRTSIACLLAAMVLFASGAARAADATQAEIDALKKDVEQLRKQLSSQSAGASTRSSVDKALDCKYGPNATVTTKSGKLTIGGLLQVWYYSIQNDNNGLFQDSTVNGIMDTNETQDNDSFRIRRAEIKFTMDIHENITAVVMIDPATEATSFPSLPGNQGLFKRRSQGSLDYELNGANGSQDLETSNVSAVQNGSGAVPRLLQDAYINYHGVIPHHDFTVGQFLPSLGEEAVRSAAQLDFVERSMIGQVNNQRDLGASVHGTWWDERFQYWLGVFNGAGNYYLSAGTYRNRSDDNDSKDFNYRVLVRPLWKNETWGSLELGMSSQMGTKGESSGGDPVAAPVNGLNRNSNWAIKHAAFASYMPGGPVKGWWLRGEWAWFKDRNAPSTVLDVTGSSNGGDNGFLQTAGAPFASQGWYFSTGYKIADSIFCDKAPAWLKPFEFAFRYETFENVQLADLIDPNTQTNVYKTQVYTGGINYYIKGHNAKIQLNYNAVRDPRDENSNPEFHAVNNNNFVVNFQVAF